jgi:trimeric autotransporter adhesin
LYNNRIRKVSKDGIITTVAGNGNAGEAGDGAALNTELNYIFGLTVDRIGNIYITDSARIRKVSKTGTITTVAGIAGQHGYSGDGGKATRAQLFAPYGVAISSDSNLFIADGTNNRIRVVSPNGIITTVVWNGIEGYSGDGGLAIAAQLGGFLNVAVDSHDTLYIADIRNHCIRKISHADKRANERGGERGALCFALLRTCPANPENGRFRPSGTKRRKVYACIFVFVADRVYADLQDRR